MKIKDLIKELQKFDPELDVIIQCDPEGNNFHPLYEVNVGGFADGERCCTSEDIPIYKEVGIHLDPEYDINDEAQKVIFLIP